MLTLANVRKTFGRIVAVDGLSLSVRKGEVLGLLGPNGAGKSTSVSLAVGLLTPASGSVTIEGYGNPVAPEVRQRIGVAPQALALYDLLTGEENLRFFGEVYGLSGHRLDERVVPTFVMPSWVQSFGVISPIRWAILAIEGGVCRNFSAAEMAMPCAILITTGLACFALGTRSLTEA